MIQTYDALDLRRLDRNVAGRLHAPRCNLDETASSRKRHVWRRRFGQHNYLDTLAYVAGTPMTWMSSTGTYVITCTSLAVYTGGTTVGCRQGGASASLKVAPPGGTAAVLPAYLQVTMQCQMTSTPAAGGEVQVYLGFSAGGTVFPAGLGTTDAAGPDADTLPQLVFCGSVIMSALLTTGVQFAYLSPVPCLDNYIVPVVVNQASVTFDATPLHTILTITPYFNERAV